MQCLLTALLALLIFQNCQAADDDADANQVVALKTEIGGFPVSVPASSQIVGLLTNQQYTDGFCGFSANRVAPQAKLLLGGQDSLGAQYEISRALRGNFFQVGHKGIGKGLTHFCETRDDGMSLQLQDLSDRVIDTAGHITDPDQQRMIGSVKEICPKIVQSVSYKAQEDYLETLNQKLYDMTKDFYDVFNEQAQIISTNLDLLKNDPTGEDKNDWQDKVRAAQLVQSNEQKNFDRQREMIEAKISIFRAQFGSVTSDCLQYQTSDDDAIAKMKVFFMDKSSHWANFNDEYFMKWDITPMLFEELKFQHINIYQGWEASDQANAGDQPDPEWTCQWTGELEHLNNLPEESRPKCPDGVGWQLIKKTVSSVEDTLNSYSSSTHVDGGGGGGWGLWSASASASHDSSVSSLNTSHKKEDMRISFKWKREKVMLPWAHREALIGDTITKTQTKGVKTKLGQYTWIDDAAANDPAANARILVSHFPTDMLLVKEFVMESQEVHDTFSKLDKSSSTDASASGGWGPFSAHVQTHHESKSTDEDTKHNYGETAIVDPDIKIAGLWLSEYPKAPSVLDDGTVELTPIFVKSLCGKFQSYCADFLKEEDRSCNALAGACKSYLSGGKSEL